MINLKDEILYILNLIKKEGYEVYLVGGFFRDSLLNIDSYDVDMTTNATPSALKQILKDYKLNEEFIKFGSVKFAINKYHFEITTFRKEKEYNDHRKPAKIEFTNSLKEDLIRRDFTINALCYDGENIYDLFNGIDDLNKKIINTIGDADIRFKEDALRILRALRFSSKLNFIISEDVKKSIENNYKFLKELNFNNLYRELKGILEGHNFINVLKEYKQILIKVFSLEDLKVEMFNNEMTYYEKEALFFYYSNIKLNNMYLINKDIVFVNDKIELKKNLKNYGYEIINKLLYFKSTYLKENTDVYKLLIEIKNKNECYNLKTLKIKGNDLIELNIKGDRIGKYLEMLLNAVIESKCSNDKENLLKYLNNILE